MNLNPIEIELLRNGMLGITDEMYIALMKSAFSTNIKERRDHSAAIFDARGRVIVQGESMPIHLASMLGLVEVVLERYGSDGLLPGDMVISNDPFVGRGSHLPDVAIVSPVFHDGKVVMYLSNIAHHADMGGMSPGSMAGGMTEIYQEGLRIPPIRLLEGGEIVEDVLELILLNVRVPKERRGDYMAQIAANRLGERRCHELLKTWGAANLTAGMDDIVEAAAQRMRAAVGDLPDGVYRFADVMDDDGVGTQDIPIAVEVKVEGENISFDFTGTGPQAKGNINLTMAGLQASVVFALKVLIDPEGPTNHGLLQPITIKAPEGTIVNAMFPAASAARAQTGQRLVDVILGALAEAMPEKALAAGNGANTSATFFGRGPDGKYYVYLETLAGGGGARTYKDGADAVQVHMTNTSNLPVEALENEYPLMIERYELVPNSGGAGTYRGGVGIHRVYRGIGHTLTFAGQGERFVHEPYGLDGGKPGGTGRFRLLHDDGSETALPVKPNAMDVLPTSALSVTTPGAGGYGLSEKRDPDQTAKDLESGLFTPDFIKTHYGV